MTNKKTPSGGYRLHTTYKGQQINLRAQTKRELMEKERRAKDDIDRGARPNSSTITVSQWCEIWLETYKKPLVTAQNFATYQSIVRRHVLPAIGSFRICDIKAYDLQQILNSRSGCSSSHTSRVKITLREIFSQALMNGFITLDPSAGLSLPPSVSGSHRSITEDEQRVLFSVADSSSYGIYIYLLYYCGLRPQEAIALLWEDVDFGRKLLHITKAVEGGTSGKVKATKTRAGVRDIPIPEVLLEKLLPNVGEPSTPVLLTDGGKQATSATFGRWWKQIRRLMNIEMGARVYRNKVIDDLVADDLTAYCIRHTYCTNLQRAGVPLNVAKYLMGHSDIKMTANIYAHHTEDQTESARKLIDNFFD